MSTKQRDVHASHAAWSCQKNPQTGEVVEYVARFPVAKKRHALGMAVWLRRKGITSARKEPLQGDDNRWVLRITRDEDNLQRFEEWPRFSQMLPERAEEIKRAKEALELKEARAEVLPENAPPLQPWPTERIENTIRQMKKAVAENNTHQRSWVLETRDSETALQVATYLEGQGYISEKVLKRIQHEADYVMSDSGSLEFLINVTGNVSWFERNFLNDPDPPTLGGHTGAVNAKRQSHFPGKGGRIAG